MAEILPILHKTTNNQSILLIKASPDILKTLFKVVWDTLQYFEGSQDSKKEL